MTRTRSRTREPRRKSGKLVTINRQQRRQLHAIWPPLVMGPLNRVASELRYYIRRGLWGDGLTPKEREFLYNKLKELDEISSELATFYYQRLKY